MAIAHLTVQEAENILLEQFGQFISLKSDGKYLLLSIENVSYITWTNSDIQMDFEGIISYGLPICSFSSKKKWIFPSIMQRLSEYPVLEIESLKIATELSKGKTISISVFDDLDQKQIIVTHKGHMVAFGQVLFGEFHSLIDIGWYLREAEQGVF